MWYQIDIEVNRAYQDSEECVDEWEATQKAEEILALLREDPDIGSWLISVRAHTCGREGPCECPEDDKPYASFEGLTLPF